MPGISTEQIIALAQAGGLVLFTVGSILGYVWAKPAVDFILQRLTMCDTLLKESLARESKLADALSEHTILMKSALDELRMEKSRKGAR